MDDNRNLLQKLINTALTADMPQELLREIGKEFGCSVCFKDVNGAVYIESEDPSFCEHVRTYPLETLKYNCHNYHVTQLLERNRCIGYFIVHGGGDVSLMDSAMLSLRVYYTRMHTEIQRRRFVESNAVQNFLTGKITPAKAALVFREHIFPLEKGSMVAVIGYKNDSGEDVPKETGLLSEIDEKLRLFFKLYTAWYDRRRLVAAFTPGFPMNESSACDSIVNMLEDIRKHGDKEDMFANMRIGFGSIKDDLTELPKSYEEADMAFRAACLVNNKRGWWHSWRSLGDMRLLMLFAENPEAENFIDMVLGSLADEANAHNKELLETLINIEKNSWNLKQTAEEMNFHYNTMKYRYMRIQEILGTDLSQPGNRFNVSLALRLKYLRQ